MEGVFVDEYRIVQIKSHEVTTPSQCSLNFLNILQLELENFMHPDPYLDFFSPLLFCLDFMIVIYIECFLCEGEVEN